MKKNVKNNAQPPHCAHIPKDSTQFYLTLPSLRDQHLGPMLVCRCGSTRKRTIIVRDVHPQVRDHCPHGMPEGGAVSSSRAQGEGERDQRVMGFQESICAVLNNFRQILFPSGTVLMVYDGV